MRITSGDLSDAELSSLEGASVAKDLASHRVLQTGEARIILNAAQYFTRQPHATRVIESMADAWIVSRSTVNGVRRKGAVAFRRPDEPNRRPKTPKTALEVDEMVCFTVFMLFDLKKSPALGSVMAFVNETSSSETPLFGTRSTCFRPIPGSGLLLRTKKEALSSYQRTAKHRRAAQDILQANLLKMSARNEFFDQDETRLPENVTRAKERVEKDCNGPQNLE